MGLETAMYVPMYMLYKVLSAACYTMQGCRSSSGMQVGQLSDYNISKKIIITNK